MLVLVIKIDLVRTEETMQYILTFHPGVGIIKMFYCLTIVWMSFLTSMIKLQEHFEKTSVQPFMFSSVLIVFCPELLQFQLPDSVPEKMSV